MEGSYGPTQGGFCPSLKQSDPYDQESSKVPTVDMLLLKLLDHRCRVRFFASI